MPQAMSSQHHLSVPRIWIEKEAVALQRRDCTEAPNNFKLDNPHIGFTPEHKLFSIVTDRFCPQWLLKISFSNALIQLLKIIV